MTPAGVGARPVVVVTGGGGGIGAAVAVELGRRGAFVVTADPLVSLDGSEVVGTGGPTTADRIVAGGGAARATSVSVTDRVAVESLLTGLAEEHGRLDVVVNAAGITRPTTFTRGTEADWRAVLEVHLDGYLAVLGAALPIMAAAGRGHVVGVTSGSGWRRADAGAYGMAKRAVAALTWQLGRVAPPGVAVAAVSPIAVTRMVTEAIARAGAGRSSSSASAGRSDSDVPGRQERPLTASEPSASPGRSGSDAVSDHERVLGASEPKGSETGRVAGTGGLDLGAMPAPEDVAPLVAHLVGGPDAGWAAGRVVFAAGSEVALVEPPRLLEVLRTDGVTSPARLLEAATPAVLAPAEEAQTSTGGTNPRMPAAPTNPDSDPDADEWKGATDGDGGADDEGPEVGGGPSADLPPAVARRCLVVSDQPALDEAVVAALATRGVECVTVRSAGAGGEDGPALTGTAGESTAGGPTGLAPATRASFAAAAGIVAGVPPTGGPVDAVVVLAPTRCLRPDGERHGGGDREPGHPPDEGEAAWVRALADHEGLVDELLADAAWSRAAATAAGSIGTAGSTGTAGSIGTAGSTSTAEPTGTAGSAAPRETVGSAGSEGPAESKVGPAPAGRAGEADSPAGPTPTGAAAPDTSAGADASDRGLDLDRAPLRLVTVVDARSPGGHSRAQAAAQLSRAAGRATRGGVAAFVVAVEGRGQGETVDPTVADLVAHLVASPSAADLSGAELVAGDGWCGLRSHPRPGPGVVIGRPDVPAWLDQVMWGAVDR